MPPARSASSMASVPLATPTRMRRAMIIGELALESLQLWPHDIPAAIRHAQQRLAHVVRQHILQWLELVERNHIGLI